MKFERLGIGSELTSSLNKMSFLNPTEVQEIAIPLILDGQDVSVRSKTGSGKTGAFLIPIINILGRSNLLEAIIIAPTRELTLQVSEVAKKIGAVYKKKVVTVYGGASMSMQINALRNGANIVVGTPGRVLDLIERRELRLGNLKFVVLDEADVMLDMGFIDDIEIILSHTPRRKQVLLFSATMPKEIVGLAAKFMNEERKNIIVGDEKQEIVGNVSHLYGVVQQEYKFPLLMAYYSEYEPKKSIIFANTKRMADRIAGTLKERGLRVSLLHGGKSQAERERALSAFRNGEDVLVATNVAARGLDFPEITDIINYDAPDDPVAYIHRIGRSARMGKEGRAFTIINDSQRILINEIKKRTKIEIKRIEVDIEPFRDLKVISHRHHGPNKSDMPNERQRGYNGSRVKRRNSIHRDRPRW
ncbi:MAG: DEAD/DEAH box helicase [Thermoplasmatales archaeon]|nr:DEAD/DEAH box helicase [Thermoplasmatales archaeon]